MQRLFAPVSRRYLYSSPSVRCSRVSFSSAGFRVIEGGQSRKGLEYRYWASLFRANASPVHYQQHRWTPVAVTHSPQAGLCASADKLGEIHVWRASDAEPVAVFKPINQHFFHVEWMEDQSGVLLSTKAFSATSSKKYDHNQYGDVNTSFSFRESKWLPRFGHETKFELEPTTKDARTGGVYKLTAYGVTDLVNQFPDHNVSALRNDEAVAGSRPNSTLGSTDIFSISEDNNRRSPAVYCGNRYRISAAVCD